MTDAERVQQSDYRRAQMTEEKALEQLKQNGGQAVQKTYPLGDGWAIKLSSVNEATFDQLKTLGRVAELDLSRSNITDAEMPRLVEVAGVCFKLNLSQTGITDAGLAALADLPLLMDLNLTGTKVSQGAVAKFKSARRSNPKVMDFAKSSTKVAL
jgi:hypothetical protein